MSEPDPAETALRAGLRALPVPNPGPDFDARVLAAVRQRRSGWRALFTGWSAVLRPVLGGAACSALVMLALLRGATNGNAPVTPIPTARATGGAAVFVAVLASPAALDAVLERGGDLSVASLTSSRPVLTPRPLIPQNAVRRPLSLPTTAPPPSPPRRTRSQGGASRASIPPPRYQRPIPEPGATIA